MNVLHKNEFIRKFAQDNDITIKDAGEITEAFLDALKNAVCDYEKVVFGRFGIFSRVYCKPKEYIHPATGLREQAPARVVLKFTPQFDILKGADPDKVYETKMAEKAASKEEETETTEG